MFNNFDMAKQNLDYLIGEVEKAKLEHFKEIKYKLAYKTNEPSLTQLKNFVIQKGIDNFEAFWFWIGSLKEPPKWFQDAMKQKATEALRDRFVEFKEVREHFENYARYIREGYNIVLISYSLGNLYAN